MSKLTLPSFIASIIILGLSSNTVFAASITQKKQSHGHGTMDHSATMNHDQMGKVAKSNTVLPKEPGQGAFATIAEIVELLLNDPKTDWSKVDIDALREHLIDMDEVSLRAKAEANILGNSITFTVTGSGRTKQAIQAMIPAHAGVLPSITPWKATAKTMENGAILTVSASSADELQKLAALGFFGVMATGAHHQAHHLAMAKGDQDVHAHK
ncbi:MAG: hypothetical protein V3V04_05655 [Rhizobiaceae bacterium]